MDHVNEYVEDAFGVYVGSVERAEMLRALGRHAGTLIVFLHMPDDSLLLCTVDHHHGVGAYTEDEWTDEQDEGEDRYFIGGRETGLPVTITDWKAVLHLPKQCPIDQYTGGFRLHLPGGLTLTLVLWHDAFRETASGDLAPLDWVDLVAEDADLE